MRNNFKILLIGLLAMLLVASASAYILLTPSYKTIEVNGYKLEVPQSNSNVTSVNDNYKTYDDKEHNITIKSYAINNVNETNYTGASDVGALVGSNIGQNTTIKNKTVMNKSGEYTYYDISLYQMIVITSNNYDSISHILKTLNKTDIQPDTENSTINLTTISSNNTTETNNTTTETTSKSYSSKKSQNSNSKTSSSSSKSKYKDDEVYDVVVPGTGGKTTKARWLGLTPEGNRYEEVGTGRIVYS